MSDLSVFPITKRWPAKHPDRLQLYSLPTPNGVKASMGFFHKFAGKDFENKRPRDRYVAETKRLLGVMETQLAGRQWIMDDEYTIADISMLGWVRNLIGFYGARDLVGFDGFKNVAAWLERGLARPAVERGLNIPKRP